jgi:hypothetical protein
MVWIADIMARMVEGMVEGSMKMVPLSVVHLARSVGKKARFTKFVYMNF